MAEERKKVTIHQTVIHLKDGKTLLVEPLPYNVSLRCPVCDVEIMKVPTMVNIQRLFSYLECPSCGEVLAGE